MVDGYDNGILICVDGPTCEQHVYSVISLTGNNDAILLFKVVRDGNYLESVRDISIKTGKNRGTARPNLWGQIVYRTSYRECISDQNGACPLFIDDKEFEWREKEGELAGDVIAWIGSPNENDLSNLYPKDERLVVIYLAVNKTGKLVDCTFTSPLTYEKPSSVCSAKKKALQTAIAGYTTTPTVTITPLPSLTPTATEVPPTPTVTPTPTALPKTFATSSGLPGWVVVIVIAGLIGIAGWIIWIVRSRRQK